ncbi:glycosyltransferase family 2 protein [Christiangramia forsetii]|uniref:Glycosyl transferase, family 2 n=2 Tax=Christiangramia forsetii TaxID=411153 RepID=A0LYU9_CHRFK|nr:glycosyltransferase [Christiangramia forsetii]GGG33305.1 glycosyl transferase [Christiangramia forsetii]CAL65544.1 glycosyl transferase, family 2 [Christiangramia forsetii KT0803]
MTNPLVSIIIPCYNNTQYIIEAINSAVNQTYQNIEIIVVDDGSDQETKTIINSLITNIDILITQNNCGLSAARNRGLDKASGKFIQFLDSDDILKPEKIDYSLRKLGNMDQESCIIISDFMIFNDKKQRFLPAYVDFKTIDFKFDQILYKWDENFSIPIHCGLFERNLFNDFRFSEKLRSKEDWVMWVNLFKKEPQVFFVDKPLVIYRVHNGSMTHSLNMFEDHMSALEILKNNLSVEEYEKLLKKFVQRYYKKSLYSQNQIRAMKNSKSYKIENFFRKVWIKMGF